MGSVQKRLQALGIEMEIERKGDTYWLSWDPEHYGQGNLELGGGWVRADLFDEALRQVEAAAQGKAPETRFGDLLGRIEVHAARTSGVDANVVSGSSK